MHISFNSLLFFMEPYIFRNACDGMMYIYFQCVSIAVYQKLETITEIEIYFCKLLRYGFVADSLHTTELFSVLRFKSLMEEVWPELKKLTLTLIIPRNLAGFLAAYSGRLYINRS